MLFVDPATTDFTNDFPNATFCGITWDDAYTYYVLSPSALESEGSASSSPDRATPPST
ncbi:MAG: hypothetical protein IPJ85_05725 [Flavobacteriales bacterium]|nr:hypothetical protein [Flavobacteriales bacterium]